MEVGARVTGLRHRYQPTASYPHFWVKGKSPRFCVGTKTQQEKTLVLRYNLQLLRKKTGHSENTLVARRRPPVGGTGKSCADHLVPASFTLLIDQVAPREAQPGGREEQNAMLVLNTNDSSCSTGIV